MSNWIDSFFHSFIAAHPPRTVYTEHTPKELMASAVDGDGWFTWRLRQGTLPEENYRMIENRFGVRFPQSFIDWHRAYFFLAGDCSLVRLPASNPLLPLGELERLLDWYVPEEIIPQELYPFAMDGNDGGLLVFDGRKPAAGNEFPIRFYDHDFGGDPEGLSDVIFSSFPKLIVCLTHLFRELQSRKAFEIVPDFFEMDTAGAGTTGKTYWMDWVAMLKSNDEENWE